MGSAILSILSALVPLAVKIIMAYIERNELDNVTRQRFLDFIESMEGSMKVPSNIRKDYQKQGDRLRERIKKIKEQEGKNN